MQRAHRAQSALFSTFGLWFGGKFALWSNIHQVFTYDNGIFARWFANTVLYVVVGAGGATLLATLAGYGMAKFDFPGKRAVFAVVLGAVAVPGTALAVPTFLLFSNLHLTNTPWAVILPSLVSPLGFYLIWVYAAEAVPTEVLEAARIDGAGEFRTFFVISSRPLAPGMVTVLLLTVVATWNNYFLPLIMLSDPHWYPLTVGLNNWNMQAATLTWWAWAPQDMDIVAAFEKKYPKVKVNRVNAGTATTEYTKLQNAIKAGSGVPDIAQIEYYALPQFAPTWARPA